MLKSGASTMAFCFAVLPHAAIAQATNADDVQVTLSIDVASDIQVGFSGDINLTTVETIFEADYDNDGQSDGSAEYYTGISTGCVHILGIDDVDIKITGTNSPHGVVGPYLKATHELTDYYVYYQPTLGFGAPNTDFSSLPAAHRDIDTAGAGVSKVYNNYDGLNHVNGNIDTYTNVMDAFGGSTEAGCASGDNAALAILVGIDGGGHESDEINNIFSDVNRFISETNLPDGSYQFNDTVTVEISPNLG